MENLHAIGSLAIQGNSFLATAKVVGSEIALGDKGPSRVEQVKETWKRSRLRGALLAVVTPFGWAIDGTRYVLAGAGVLAGAALTVATTVGATLWGGACWMVNAIRKGVNTLTDAIKGKADAKPVADVA